MIRKDNNNLRINYKPWLQNGTRKNLKNNTEWQHRERKREKEICLKYHWLRHYDRGYSTQYQQSKEEYKNKRLRVNILFIWVCTMLHSRKFNSFLLLLLSNKKCMHTHIYIERERERKGGNGKMEKGRNQPFEARMKRLIIASRTSTFTSSLLFTNGFKMTRYLRCLWTAPPWSSSYTSLRSVL